MSVLRYEFFLCFSKDDSLLDFSSNLAFKYRIEVVLELYKVLKCS